MEPKVPEDIYKSHLEPTRGSIGQSNVDSARQNLASSFVNGFVNAAFGQDKLLMEDGNKRLYKNKEHGTGNVLKIQQLLHLCSEHDEKKDAAVDVVGQAVKPKTITGFQTHTTPVLLAYGERAELATDEYLPMTPVMEGFVVLKKNPDFEST